MFNSTHNQKISIHAVSGTIVKSYKESFIVRFHIHSSRSEEVFDENPHYGETPVVVLQVMVCDKSELIVELISKEDFNRIYADERTGEQCL